MSVVRDSEAAVGSVLDYAGSRSPGTRAKLVPCLCIAVWFTSLPILILSPVLDSVDNRYAVPIVLFLAVGLPLFAVIWGAILRRRLLGQKGSDKLTDIPLIVNIVLLVIALGILVLVLPVYFKSFF